MLLLLYIALALPLVLQERCPIFRLFSRAMVSSPESFGSPLSGALLRRRTPLAATASVFGDDDESIQSEDGGTNPLQRRVPLLNGDPPSSTRRVPLETPARRNQSAFDFDSVYGPTVAPTKKNKGSQKE